MVYQAINCFRWLALSLMVLSICNKSSNSCSSSRLSPSRASWSITTSPRSLSNVVCNKAILKRTLHALSAVLFRLVTSLLINLMGKAGLFKVELDMTFYSLVNCLKSVCLEREPGAKQATNEISPDLFPLRVLYSSHSRQNGRNNTLRIGIRHNFFIGRLFRPLLIAYPLLKCLSMTVKTGLLNTRPGAQKADCEKSPDLFPVKVLYSSHARHYAINHTLFNADFTQGIIYG